MLANLRPDGDGTVTGWSAVGGSGTHASAFAQDPHAHDNGSSYVMAPNAADGSMFAQLGPVPHNFDPAAVNSITIRVAALFVNTPQMTVDLCDLYLQLFRSDETTVMSAESTVCNVTSTAGYVIFERTVALSGTHNLSDWDGVRLRLRQDHTAQQTTDTVAQIRITAAVVVVDYTSSVGVTWMPVGQLRRRRKPPHFARVDQGHPLARGIRFFIDCRGGFAYDLVRGVPLTRSGTIDFTHDPRFLAQASVFNSTDNFSVPANTFVDDINGGALALIWRGYLTSLAGGSLLLSKDAVGDQELLWYLGGADSFNFLRINAANNNDATWRVTGIDQPTGEWVTYGVTQAAQIESTPLSWRNKTAQAVSNVGGGATGLGRAATNPVRVGRDSNSLGQLAGNVSHVIGFARQIAEGEYFDLEENPWQILEAQRNRIYFNTVAGGGATTVDAVLVTHSYTGQAPKVSVKVQPGEVAHAYTSQAPQVRARVQPAQVTHSYTGQVPSIEAGEGLFPPAATHSYTARAPQVRAQVRPGPVTHTYSGVAPKFAGALKPAQAAHAYTGQVPRMVGTQRPPAATHTYTGRAPQAKVRVQPAAATHTYTGRVPGFQAGLGVFAPAATHSYSGQVAQLKAQVRPGAAVHTYTGRAAQLKARVQSAPVTHSYTARAPQVRESVRPAAATHSYQGRAPQLKARVQPQAASHSYTGRLPGLFSGSSFFPPAAVHSYTARAPQLQAQVRAPAAVHVYSAKAPAYVAQIAFTAEPLRGRIGGTPAVDTHTRIGSAPVDENERIGPAVGTVTMKRIGDPAK